jgi:outer membrane protein assembly factor BamA
MYISFGKNWLLFFFIWIVSSQATTAQIVRKTLDYAAGVLADTASAEKPRFIVYPTIAFSPETSWEFGASALLVYHAGRDTTNRLSELNAFTFITLERQYGFWVDHALYSNRDDWFFLGRLRYQRFPLKYYGIGSDTPSEYQAVVDGNVTLIRERVLRRVYGSIYAGIEVDYQSLSESTFKFANDEQQFIYPTGSEGSRNLGLGIGLVHDQRHNVLNVREGFFGEVAWLAYRPAWFSDYSFNTTYVDLRYYRPMPRKEVLAFQLYGIMGSGELPFNQMALMGGETMMRGYYTGRYRDERLAAFQVEYRWLPFAFSKRWGAAAFLSTGTVFSRENRFNTDYLRLAGGGGIRFLLFPKKDIFTRIDVAFTREGQGYYFFIGEAF